MSFLKKLLGIKDKDVPSTHNNYYNDYDEVSAIDGMEGHNFEYFCADILKKNGFYDVKVTKGSGDQGVDILAEKDGIKYAIQCKNYSTYLGNTPIQEVNAGKTFYNCHVGVVMTNSYFTQGAKDLAKATGVLTWDRTYLQRMMDYANVMPAPQQQFVYQPNNEQLVDENEILNDIQKQIDNYADIVDRTGDAMEIFIDAIEKSSYEKVQIDREMIRLGGSVKKLGIEINNSVKQIETDFLKLFESLKKQGFTGWTDDRETMDDIRSFYNTQKNLLPGLFSLKNSIANMKNCFNINNSVYKTVQQQTIQDILYGISLFKQADISFETVFREYEKLKKGKK